jgi:hypothetical protein
MTATTLAHGLPFSAQNATKWHPVAPSIPLAVDGNLMLWPQRPFRAEVPMQVANLPPTKRR